MPASPVNDVTIVTLAQQTGNDIIAFHKEYAKVTAVNGCL